MKYAQNYMEVLKYGSLEINGKKVLSARSANKEDFYDVTYSVSRTYKNNKKIEPIINQKDTINHGFSIEQFDDYVDIENTSEVQSKNTQMLAANASPTITNASTQIKDSTSMLNTGNSYWLATRQEWCGYNNSDGQTQYSEDLSYEDYQISCVRTDGVLSASEMFYVNQYNVSGNNRGSSCALRPVITVSADSVSDTSVGASVNVDRFYKTKNESDAHGYVKADSIVALLGKDIKSLSKVNSGLPTVESDMTWSKLTDGGYDLQSSSFDTSKYDYYIANRATELQIRLTGAPAYNNGVLALDTICNNLYGNLTEVKLKNGQTKKVKVILARNAKWEDFADDSKINNDPYGSIWATNSDDSEAPNKIISTYNSYAPTLFTQYENIDKTKGVSKGYSDAKITSYNMSTSGTNSWLSTDKKGLYSYEKYNTETKSNAPWLKVVYNNYYFANANRNTENVRVNSDFWLSSRCIDANWNYVGFMFRSISPGGLIYASYVILSSTNVSSTSKSLRPVLQVLK